MGPTTYVGDPDVGTAAWIDCAGHLPWGQSTDQRFDDDRSLTWDLEPPRGSIVGYPRVHLRVSTDTVVGSLSVKLCEVSPDGTSALVSRGTLDLAFRSGAHGPAVPLAPGEAYDVDFDLDACAYEFTPGRRLRISVAGSDWPNTVAPPAPFTLAVHEGRLELPMLQGEFPTPSFTPGSAHSSETLDGVTWELRNDVLRRVTTAVTGSVSAYPTPYDGTAREDYQGEVSVNRRTHLQGAHADTTYDLTWPDVSLQVRSVMDVEITGAGYDVHIDVRATRDDSEVSHRTWQEHIDR